MSQQDGIDVSETNPCTHGQVTYYKGGKNTQWRSLFKKWCWENCIVTYERMKLEHSLTTHTELNSKWIKDLNIRLDTIKLLEGP